MNKRNQNIELIRIISMIMIIILHILEQGGFVSNYILLSAKYNVLWFVEMAVFCCVNLFALISGYIYINKEKVKLKNLISLWFQVSFYSLGIFFIFLFISPSSVTVRSFINSCLPIISNQYWYITAYFGMYLFIPYINRFIKSLSKREFKNFILILILIFSVLPTISPIDIFNTNGGFSTLWLIVMYFIGAYLNIFKEEFSKKSNLKNLIIYILSIVCIVGFKFTIELITLKILGEAKLGNYFFSYTSLFIVIASIALFIFILNIKISEKLTKIINLLGKLSLGVYLTHTNPLFFKLVWPKLFLNFTKLSLFKTLGVIIGATIIVFIIGVSIEWMRVKLFKILKVNNFIEKI